MGEVELLKRIERLEFALAVTMGSVAALEAALKEEPFGERVMARTTKLRPDFYEQARQEIGKPL